MIKVLALPGSLREDSSSSHILRAIGALAPTGVSFEIFDGIGSLPHFNDPTETPEVVLSFRNKIKKADAVLICTPEYAFGIPGSLKNALDWTVGSGEFAHKSVGVVTASSQGEKGHAAMLLVLGAMSARVVNEACMVISFVRSKIDPSGNIKDDALRDGLSQIVGKLVKG